MLAELVDVAPLGFRLLLRYLILVEVVLLDVVVVDLLLQLVEAELPHVDVVQGPQLLLELLEVPLRQLSGLVVRKPEGSDLLLREIVRDDAWDLLHAEALCALYSCMTADHDVVLVDDHGDLESKTFYTRGHGFDRSVVVSWVVLVRDQLVDVLLNNLQHQTTSL